jgi:hypothetical protein
MNSILTTNIETITEILDFARNSGVQRIDPAEVLEHLTSQAAPLVSIDAEQVAEYQALGRAAMATPCDFAGCTGFGHEHIVPVSEWTHDADSTFDGGIITVTHSRGSGREHSASIYFEGSGDMTASELRHDADKYEAFPAWLRSMADRLDALASGVQVNR